MEEERTTSRISEAEIKIKLMQTISKASGGITHGELTDKTGLHRNTVYKYLQQLAEDGVLAKKTYGRTDVWSLSENRIEEMVQLPLRMLQNLAVALQKIDGLSEESRGRMRKLAHELISFPDTIKDEMAMPITKELLKFKKEGLPVFFEKLNRFSQVHPHNKIEFMYSEKNRSGEIIVNNCMCNGTQGNELVCTFVEGALEGIFKTRMKLPLKIREKSCGILEGTKKCTYHFEVLSPPKNN